MDFRRYSDEILSSSQYKQNFISIEENNHLRHISDDDRGLEQFLFKIFINLSTKITILTFSWQYFVELLSHMY